MRSGKNVGYCHRVLVCFHYCWRWSTTASFKQCQNWYHFVSIRFGTRAVLQSTPENLDWLKSLSLSLYHTHTHTHEEPVGCVVVTVVWTRRPVFKSWTRQFAFHIVLILMEKAWIQITFVWQQLQENWNLGRSECLGIYKYIYSHPQTISLYHNSSLWLDTRNGSSWDQNPSVGYFTPELPSFSA